MDFKIYCEYQLEKLVIHTVSILDGGLTQENFQRLIEIHELQGEAIPFKHYKNDDWARVKFLAERFHKYHEDSEEIKEEFYRLLVKELRIEYFVNQDKQRIDFLAL